MEEITALVLRRKAVDQELTVTRKQLSRLRKRERRMERLFLVPDYVFCPYKFLGPGLFSSILPVLLIAIHFCLLFGIPIFLGICLDQLSSWFDKRLVLERHLLYSRIEHLEGDAQDLERHVLFASRTCPYR